MTFKNKIRNHTAKQLLYRIIIIIYILVLFGVFSACMRDTELSFMLKNDFFVLAEWQNANCSFTLEYYYPEFDKEIKQTVTEEHSFLIERKRGVLKARVKPNTKKGEFSEWKEFQVSPLPLEDPNNVGVISVGNGVYNIKFDKVYYKAKENEDKEVPSYQLQLKIGDGSFNDYPPMSYLNMTSFEFYFPLGEEITVRLRALNYFYNEMIGEDKMPKELYWRYEIKNEWKEYRITL